MSKLTELSYKESNTISLWAQHLLCLRCLNGGGRLPFMEAHNLSEILNCIKGSPIVYIKLLAAFDEIGSRTELFSSQTHIERKRDLDVLQILGLVPNSIRMAKDLFRLIEERIPSLEGICTYEITTPGKWDECPLARDVCFENGKEGMYYVRRKEEMQQAKLESCSMIETADRLFIRVHHLLCISCFIGNGEDVKPIIDDNLYEVWKKMKENPQIPVTVVEGCSSCMICPPCQGYEPVRGVCHLACHLRDRKKDLDVFNRLGLIPGDTLPAEDLISLVYERISTVKGICDYGTATCTEWKGCGGASTEVYEKRRELGLFR